MKYNIDIDAGSIFTSGFIWDEGQTEFVKVETTPDDLTTGFSHCISELVKKCHFTDLDELLKNTEIIKLSSAMGTLLTRMHGPKLGLLVTSGYEKNLYNAESFKNEVFDVLISPDMVAGITGSIDTSGKIAQELNKDEVRKSVKQLLVQGARFLVVSLLNSSLNSTLEEQIREIVEFDYPKHFLGSIPVMLSTETSLTRDNAYRTKVALLDAFIHRRMTRYFYQTDEELRNTGYQKHLFIIHNSGGAARTAKTKAVNTIGASQIATLYGACHLSQVYGLPDMAIINAGGANTGVGLIINGKCTMPEESEIPGLPVVRLPLSKTIVPGVGGNSIVNLSKASNSITIGPDIVDNKTGPACYGSENGTPTVIDACVVLGYTNPDYFMGGEKTLNYAHACEVIRQKIAEPLRMTVEQAALEIVKVTESVVGNALKELCTGKRVTANKMALLACGGMGGILCNGVSKKAGINRIYIAPFAATFSAFGSSTMDVLHEYESPVMVVLRTASGEYPSSVGRFNEILEELIGMSIRDMQGEGFSRETIQFNLELEIRCTNLDLTARVAFPRLRFENQEDIKLLIKELEKAYPDKSLMNDDIVVEMLKLKATRPLHHPELPSYQHEGTNPGEALKGYREVFLDGGPINVPIYEHRKLRCGNIVAGPAVIEGPYTSIIIPEDKQYSVDTSLFGLIEAATKRQK